MAKRPARRAMTEVGCRSTVRLSIGDDVTDQADIQLRFNLKSTLAEDAPSFSTGMSLVIQLPEGSVVADPAAAKASARAEAAAILRKMAADLTRA